MLRINLFHLSLPSTTSPNSPLRYFLPPTSNGTSEKEEGEQSSELESTGHFMMTTKVVRPPLGRREKEGGKARLSCYPCSKPFFFRRDLRREEEEGRKRMEEKEERGWITKAEGPPFFPSQGSCCSQGLELIAFITQKKKTRLPSTLISPSLFPSSSFPLTLASILHPYF